MAGDWTRHFTPAKRLLSTATLNPSADGRAREAAPDTMTGVGWRAESDADTVGLVFTA